MVRGNGGEWRWLTPYFAIVICLYLAAQSLGTSYGMDPARIIGGYAQRILVVGPIVLFVFVCGSLVWFIIRREASPIGSFLKLFQSRFSTPYEFAAVAAVVFAIPYLLGAFGLFKMALPQVVPFAWDDYLANADRLLFLGIDPWRITHAVLGSAASTSVIDRLYTLWVPLVMVGVIVACLAKPVARAQYLLSFAVAWVLIGVVGAYLLSSAGPCYSHLIGTQAADWFAPLRERLIAQHAEVRLGAVGWQSTLWNSNVLHDYGFARGISAAPSMHNAICMLYVLALWNAGRVWRTLSCVYAGVIWVGSVHTGWHYAVDGLIAWAMMAAIWNGVGAYLRWCGYAARREPEAMEPAGELEPVFVRESAVA